MVKPMSWNDHKDRHGYFIGLISGTSMDGIDAALIHWDGKNFELTATLAGEYPAALRQELTLLCVPGADDLDRYGRCHRQVGEVFADTALQLLNQARLSPSQIIAIGHHGQTVRHRPGNDGFSLQLGSADVLSTRTGIPVIADFRMKDMALGGQGAPLVPRFHQALWRNQAPLVIANIGGISNITVLDATGEIVTGFDTGTGNGLMDAWFSRHHEGTFDRNGDWARTGKVNPALLDAMLQDPYFALPPPKSSGREYFHLAWLDCFKPDDRPENIQATLLELTAQTLWQSASVHAPVTLAVCGGGAHNSALMQRLQELAGSCHVTSTAALGLSPDWVEASAFAWLAWAYFNQVPGNAPVVTGASTDAILGALYLP